MNSKLSKAELLKRYGDMSAVCRATEYAFTSGMARGMRAVDVVCGPLAFTVLPDRCMDICYASFEGTPIGFISKTGPVSPYHYDEPDFLRSFTAGLLTTCGLTYMGAPSVDEGEALGLHGRASNLAASDVCVSCGFEGDDYVVTIKGKVRQVKVFGENVLLCRTISAKLGESKIHIYDTVENQGFTKTPFMLLYHMNFGYPLVDEGTVLETNLPAPRPRDADAEAGLETYKTFEAPQPGYREQVFYHKSEKTSYASLYNKNINLEACVRYDGGELPYLMVWKQMGEGEYVVGMEPGTWCVDGRSAARARGELTFLQPQQLRSFHVELDIFRK